MRHPATLACALLAALSACAAPVGWEAGGEDLGSVGAKDDTATSVRRVAIDLAPGRVKRFRVRAHRFHAVLAQGGDVPAKLSAKHYEIELDGDVAADPEIEVAAPAGMDEVLRNWTLRVHNLGEERLVGELTITAVEELPDSGGVIREVQVVVAPWSTRRYRVHATSIRAELTMDDPVQARLSAKHYEVEAEGEPDTSPTLVAQSPDGSVRNWTLRVHNLSGSELLGRLTVRVLDEGETPDPGRSGPPALGDAVLYENDYCTYGDAIPYVRSLKLRQPLVQAAARRLVAGWRSTTTYSEWRVPYALENDRRGTDEERSLKRARNFLKALCGELRDYPELLGQRLQAIAGAQRYAGPGEMGAVDTGRNLFSQLSYPGYVRLVDTMGAVYAYRRAALAGDLDGYAYGFAERGHGSNRVDHSVAPWTHCEMKFIFERYLGAGAPSYLDPERYERDYEDYRATSCSADDLQWMYNFRGHFTFQPLWLESNGFNYGSRRARGAEISRHDRSYYLRPYATRRDMARRLMATYLFHSAADHARMVAASEPGGGPILYITDQDADADGLLDYELFGTLGCGDGGIQMPIPSRNCNMVSWEQAYYAGTTTGHDARWDPQRWSTPDMGFMRTFGTFEERMDRLNQAIDRHTNWGPTGYYMVGASDEGDLSPRFRGNISPFVAASYDVSKSDYFVRRDSPGTGDWESGRAKWLFVMRFRAERYYDEGDLRAGRQMDFAHDYFNETSLSNDYYAERALDHWGAIPGEEHYAQVYLGYGDRGVEPPPEREVPPAP